MAAAASGTRSGNGVTGLGIGGLETESDTPLEGGWCAPPPASLPFHLISESSNHHHHHPGSTWKSRELAANSVNISQNPLQPLFCETRPGSFRAMGCPIWRGCK